MRVSGEADEQPQVFQENMADVTGRKSTEPEGHVCGTQLDQERFNKVSYLRPVGKQRKTTTAINQGMKSHSPEKDTAAQRNGKGSKLKDKFDSIRSNGKQVKGGKNKKGDSPRGKKSPISKSNSPDRKRKTSNSAIGRGSDQK